MAKLSDTQGVILVHAAQRDSGSLYPLPETLRRGGGTARALIVLTSVGYAEERETSDGSAVQRSDGDLRYGLFITAAGLAAIGVTDGAGDAGASFAAPGAAPAPAPAATPARVTKASTVVALLTREVGATLSELIEATGWLPHTTRAALTGLRKKGHAIVRCSREGTTCYRIVAA